MSFWRSLIDRNSQSGSREQQTINAYSSDGIRRFDSVINDIVPNERMERQYYTPISEEPVLIPSNTNKVEENTKPIPIEITTPQITIKVSTIVIVIVIAFLIGLVIRIHSNQRQIVNLQRAMLISSLRR